MSAGHGKAALVAALLGALISSGARAQAEAPKSPGLFTEIRRALSFRPAAEVYAEAVRTPSAGLALPMMTSLLSRTSDRVYAGKAALWLGHYAYSSGRMEEALGYFEQALERSGEEAERAEAAFWIAQCRSMLGRQEGAAGSPSEGIFGLLASVVSYDQELKAGEIESAWRGYLSLEGDARRTGCVGPLLYRLGLIAAAGRRGDDRDGSAWSVLKRWVAYAPASPERALVAGLEPVPAGSGEPPEDAGGNAAGSGVAPAPAPAEGAPAGQGEAEEALPPANPPPSADQKAPETSDASYAVQLGAFIDGGRAQREYRRLTDLQLPVRLDEEEMGGRTYYKIRMGRLPTRPEAEDLARRECRGLDWQVVRVTP